MNGLFATLVAAAQGTAPAAEPQPRARFDDDIESAPVVEWRRAEPVEEPEVRSPARATPATSARDGAAEVASPAPSPPARTAAPPAAPASLLPSRAAAPHVEPTVREAATDEPTPRRPYEDTTRIVREADEPRTASSSRQAAAPAPVISLTGEIGPSRLLPAAPSSPPGEAATAAPNRAPPGEAADAVSGPTLTIGRIEVRPPAPASAAPAPAKAAAVTTRAVIVPRAQVRQSLDDYRASRRR